MSLLLLALTTVTFTTGTITTVSITIVPITTITSVTYVTITTDFLVENSFFLSQKFWENIFLVNKMFLVKGIIF